MVLLPIVFTLFLICKYEKPCNSDTGDREHEEEPAGILYQDEVWKPCVKSLDPVWFLAYRILAFFVLSVLLSFNVAVDGGSIFYFYTQLCLLFLMGLFTACVLIW